MTQQATLPVSLVQAASEHNWPIDLITRYLGAGFSAERLERAIRSGVTPQQMRQMMAARQGGGGGTLGSLQATISSDREFPPLDMSWAKAPTERGRLPEIGDTGLELKAIEQGTYGFVPDHWPYENDTPRGAFQPEDGGLAASYSIYDKAEVWADNAAALYEEAIRNHWPSATSVPWNTLEKLPRPIELAIDQLCTNWSEQSQLGLEAVSKWLEEISYGFHEVKMYLATVCFDYGRHTEAFRKRALANGGGLGMQTPGTFDRAVYSAMKFTEMASMQLVFRASFQITLFEKYADVLSRSEADRKLYELVARDLRRHLAYGIEHLKYYVSTSPHKRGRIHAYLNRGETAWAADMRRNKPQAEALMLLLDSDPRVAKTKLQEMRKQQLADYEENLRQALLPDHQVSEFLLNAIEPPSMVV